MNSLLKNLFFLPTLITGLGLILVGRVTAQTFTTLHNFSLRSSDGAFPVAGLVLSGNTLYGTTPQNSYTSNNATVFRVNTDGTRFTNLHTFPAAAISSFDLRPELIVSGNKLFGTASGGGTSGNGTVFAINTDGTGFTNLYNFTATRTNSSVIYTNSDGANPLGGVTLSGNTLYGTASGGGSSGNGTVFRLNTDGTAFTNLLNFALPGLVLSGNTLYGTGSNGLIKVNTDGTGFTNLYTFTALVYYGGDCPPASTNTDGAGPNSLILSGNTLYGTAGFGGTFGGGTVFKVKTDGTGFSNLYNIESIAGGDIPCANGEPGTLAKLFLWGNTLYGTSLHGVTRFGTVFALNTDGTGFTNLHIFSGTIPPDHLINFDGANPYAGLILSGNTLYGTAHYGGSFGGGTVFSLSFPPPQLTIAPSVTNLILTWPPNYAGFDYTGYILQSSTNLGSAVIWTTNSPSPVVVNGQNTVTNLIYATEQFYRLSK